MKMRWNMKIGIIIPCYNEEKRLNVSAFQDFLNTEKNYHLCFVNDGSNDNTLSILKELQSNQKEKVSVVNMRKNSGKASAVRHGARYLYSRKGIEYLGFIDADLSTNFKDFKALVRTLKKNNNLDMVYGSRKKGHGKIQRSFFRYIFSQITKLLINVILGLPVEDTQCGAKVFRRRIIPVICNMPFKTKWLFDVEIFIKLKHYYGKKQVLSKIREQALKRWVHVDNSKLGIRDALQIPYKLLTIWIAYTVIPLFVAKYSDAPIGETIEIRDDIFLAS